MTLDPRHPSPLSWVLFAGLGLEFLPEPVSRPILRQALERMRRAHPAIFKRMADLGETVLLIDPIDLPVHFLLRPAGRGPDLRMRHGEAVAGSYSAAIRAPLMTLISLLEGRLDGDAAFFERSLIVEGETSAVLVFRNALEEGDVRIGRDLFAGSGPLSQLLLSGFAHLRALPHPGFVPRLAALPAGLDRRLAGIQASLLRPHAQQLAAVELALAELREAGARSGLRGPRESRRRR